MIEFDLKEVPPNFQQCTATIRLKVMGQVYRPKAQIERVEMELIDKQRKGEELCAILSLEPENEFDPGAMKVLVSVNDNGRITPLHIGYIQKHINRKLKEYWSQITKSILLDMHTIEVKILTDSPSLAASIEWDFAPSVNYQRGGHGTESNSIPNHGDETP